MRSRIPFLFIALLLAPSAPPARAEGRWCVSLAAGESVSSHHGSALDAAVFAQVDPLLGIGLETGLAYMNLESRTPPVVFPVDAGSGTVAALSDGITRNRGYYLGPAVKVGGALYAVASTGLYEFSDNSGQAQGTHWGGSAGLGVSGPGRFEPRAELRYRWAGDALESASA